MFEESYDQFLKGMKTIFGKDKFKPRHFKDEHLRSKMEIFAALAHTTELGRQQALKVAQMDIQSQQSENKKNKNIKGVKKKYNTHAKVDQKNQI